jgi:predicted phage terminase large subunit-like protein
LILRRRFGDLNMPGGLVPTSREWLASSNAKFNADKYTWMFPSGASLSFGYLDHTRDLDRYQGSQLQFVAFDELTQFPEDHYRYLFSRLRRPEGLDVPLRMRAASNPGGIGHSWVKQRFLVEGEEHGRVYVPALLQDNPSLDREQYVESLQQLDPLTRQRLLDGDWDATAEGGMFRASWFPVIEADQLPKGMRWYRFWDRAATAPEQGKDPDWTCGVLIAQHKGAWYVRDVQRFQASSQGNETRIKRTAEMDGRRVIIRFEQEPGSSGKDVISYYQREVLKGYDFKGVRSTGSKIERAGPVASAAEAGNLLLVSGHWIGDFLDELAGFPMVNHDDQVDALSGGFACALYKPFRTFSFRITDL